MTDPVDGFNYKGHAIYRDADGLWKAEPHYPEEPILILSAKDPRTLMSAICAIETWGSGQGAAPDWFQAYMDGNTSNVIDVDKYDHGEAYIIEVIIPDAIPPPNDAISISADGPQTYARRLGMSNAEIEELMVGRERFENAFMKGLAVVTTGGIGYTVAVIAGTSVFGPVAIAALGFGIIGRASYHYNKGGF